MTTHPLGRVAHPVRLHRLLLGLHQPLFPCGGVAAQGRAGYFCWMRRTPRNVRLASAVAGMTHPAPLGASALTWPALPSVHRGSGLAIGLGACGG